MDFSEDNEPIDELGDSAGPLGAVVAAPDSEADDAELPGLPREFKGSVTMCTLPGLSSERLPKLVFISTFVFTSEAVVIANDKSAFPEPLLLASLDDSTYMMSINKLADFTGLPS